MRSNEAYGMQADASYALNGSHTLRSGLFVQYEHAIVNNTSSVFPADADGNQTSSAPFSITDNGTLGGTTMGFYLQDEWKATDKLTVNYGARYDHVNTVVSEQQLSPRLGLTYELSHATRLHAGYARYFTPPPTELIDTTSVAAFQGTTNALPSGATTSVRSERSNYFDLGISPPGHAQPDAGPGRLLPRRAPPAGRGPVRQRADLLFLQLRARTHLRPGRHGQPARATSAPMPTWRCRGRWPRASRAGNSTSPPTNSPTSPITGCLDHDQTVSGSFGASYLWRGTQFSGDALFGSGLRNGFANTTHLPGYFQVNVGVAHTFDAPVIGKLKTRFSIVNLFDRSYALRDGTGIGVGAPQYAPRRLYLALSSRSDISLPGAGRAGKSDARCTGPVPRGGAAPALPTPAPAHPSP